MIGSVVAAGAAFQTQEQTDNQTDDPQTETHLRIAHAVPDAPAVNVTLEPVNASDDGETTDDAMAGSNQTFENVSVNDVTEYRNLTAGEYNVTITAADQASNVIHEGNVTLEPRTPQTLAVSGEFTETSAGESLDVNVLKDNALEPEDQSSALSVVHLSPDADAVDVVVAEGPGDDNETEGADVGVGDDNETDDTETQDNESDDDTVEVGTPIADDDEESETGDDEAAPGEDTNETDDNETDAIGDDTNETEDDGIGEDTNETEDDGIGADENETAENETDGADGDDAGASAVLQQDDNETDDNETEDAGVGQDDETPTDDGNETDGIGEDTNETEDDGIGADENETDDNETDAIGEDTNETADDTETEGADVGAQNETDDSETDTTEETTGMTEADTAQQEAPDVIAENVSYLNASEYVTVPAGDYTLEIREHAENNDGEVIATVDVTVEEGQAHSAMVTGFSQDTEDTPAGESLNVTTVQDATVTVNLPDTMDGAGEDDAMDEDTPMDDENETDDNETDAIGDDTNETEDDGIGLDDNETADNETEDESDVGTPVDDGNETEDGDDAMPGDDGNETEDGDAVPGDDGNETDDAGEDDGIGDDGNETGDDGGIGDDGNETGDDGNETGDDSPAIAAPAE